MSDKNSGTFGVREGLAIAALPLIAYFYDFLYQSGYCDFFGIPREFISIDPSSIVRTTASLIAVVILGAMVIAMVIGGSRRRASRYSGKARRIVYLLRASSALYCAFASIPALLFVSMVAAYDKGGQYGYGSALIFGGFGYLLKFVRFLAFASVLVTLAAILVGLLGYIIGRVTRRRSAGPTSATDPLSRLVSWLASRWTRTSAVVATLSLYVLYGAAVCYLAGVTDASQDSYFLIHRVGQQDRAVIRIFADTIIEESVWRKRGLFGSVIAIQRLGNSKPTVYEHAKLYRNDVSASEKNELFKAIIILGLFVLVVPIGAMVLAGFARVPNTARKRRPVESRKSWLD